MIDSFRQFCFFLTLCCTYLLPIQSLALDNLKVEFATIVETTVSVIDADHGNAYCQDGKNPTFKWLGWDPKPAVCSLTHSGGKTDITFNLKNDRLDCNVEIERKVVGLQGVLAVTVDTNGSCKGLSYQNWGDTQDQVNIYVSCTDPVGCDAPNPAPAPTPTPSPNHPDNHEACINDLVGKPFTEKNCSSMGSVQRCCGSDYIKEVGCSGGPAEKCNCYNCAIEKK